MNKNEAIQFIKKTGQPVAYIKDGDYYRFQNIVSTSPETIYKYSSMERDLIIKVNKDRTNIKSYIENKGNIYNYLK